MWKPYWGLSTDPFDGTGATYVPTATHDEAVARLADSIESGARLAVLRAVEGYGRSTVLTRAVAETKGPNRRFSRVSAPVDGPAMFAALAAGLGATVPAAATRATGWRALADAVKLCRWQKLHAVLVIDDCHDLTDAADRRDLERLAHLETNPATRLTVIQSFREPGEIDDLAGDTATPWQLVIRLSPMTRAETARYVEEKLAAAGRSEPAFSPRALGRIHDLSGGVPRGIDRLGSLSLMAGALWGLETVTPDVVEGVARECTLAGPVYAG